MNAEKTTDGARTWSRFVLTLDVAHDGDPDLLGRHLGLEVEALVDRLRTVDLIDCPWVDAAVVDPGDEMSAYLPGVAVVAQGLGSTQ